jgi:hypothetical protein
MSVWKTQRHRGIEFTFFIDVTTMIDYVNTMFHALLYGVSGTSMCAKPPAQLVCFVYTCSGFLVFEIAILSRTNLCDLIKVSLLTFGRLELVFLPLLQTWKA